MIKDAETCGICGVYPVKNVVCVDCEEHADSRDLMFISTRNLDDEKRKRLRAFMRGLINT